MKGRFMEKSEVTLLLDETRALVQWAQGIHQEYADDIFAGARLLARRLGAHYKDGLTEFGFWAPQLQEQEIPHERLFLEIYTPLEDLDLQAESQTLRFRRQRLQLMMDDAFVWGVVEGLTAGTRDQVGDFYQLVYQDRFGEWTPIRDHLAYSIPFGAFAPAELYDMAGMLAQRQDKAHFHQLTTAPDPDGVDRIQEPMNILQIHARYASPDGTIAGLTEIYAQIAEKIQAGESLSPAEENYVGYDAIQLMPIEPIIEYENGESFWQVQSDEPFAEEVDVLLHRPDMTNWGYDIVISASSATNPTLLMSRRPDELLALIETFHNFPNKPIMVMFDIVYGHIDNQSLPLLNKEYFAGANMYGQNVNFLNPYVRANLLEMQRRKHNYGVDGVRVDGAQDFKNWDPETDTMWHDDDYLHQMNDIEQDVDGVVYRPWMIFEDGRPWPRDDWELASTYREVTKIMPNVWQWGPLTFAHNTPFLFTFWMQKWWRIREMADVGQYWITGCANHDTLRRGTQVPLESRINTYLGDTYPEIIRNAYDNPAAKMFDYVMMPGVPMDFINASMRAPWGFIRNNDDRYGVKVVSEEALWMYWSLNESDYASEDAFERLKAMGFMYLADLRRFLRVLDHVVQATDYYLDAMVLLLRNVQPSLALQDISVAGLKAFARAFMDDVHDYCNVWRFEDALDPKRTAYNLAVRNFRAERRWLIQNLRDGEVLDYLHPSDGSALFYGLRVAPDGSEEVLFVANMEGAPRTLTLADLPLAVAKDGWQVALKTPYLEQDIMLGAPLTLEDSQGVVLVRKKA
jgi:hypothetical protein